MREIRTSGSMSGLGKPGGYAAAPWLDSTKSPAASPFRQQSSPPTAPGLRRAPPEPRSCRDQRCAQSPCIRRDAARGPIRQAPCGRTIANCVIRKHSVPDALGANRRQTRDGWTPRRRRRDSAAPDGRTRGDVPLSEKFSITQRERRRWTGSAVPAAGTARCPSHRVWRGVVSLASAESSGSTRSRISPPGWRRTR